MELRRKGFRGKCVFKLLIHFDGNVTLLLEEMKIEVSVLRSNQSL